MQTVKPKSYSFKERLEFSEEGEILCIEFLNAFSETFKENCIVTSNQNESNYRTCTDAHLMNNPDIKIELLPTFELLLKLYPPFSFFSIKLFDWFGFNNSKLPFFLKLLVSSEKTNPPTSQILSNAICLSAM